MNQGVNSANLAELLNELGATGIDVKALLNGLLAASFSDIMAAIDSASDTPSTSEKQGKKKAQNNGALKFSKKEIESMPLKYSMVFAVKDNVVHYRQKPNGVYEARFHRKVNVIIDNKETIQRIDIEVSSKDLTELKKKFIKALNAIEQEESSKNKTENNVLFNDYAEEWLRLREKNKMCKESTLKRYRQQLEKNFYPFFQGKTISELNRELIQEFIDIFVARGNKAMPKKHLTLLNAILKVAADDFNIKIPTKYIKVPYHEPDKGKLLEKEDEKKLIDYCLNHPDGATANAILTLWGFGLRTSELSSIMLIDDNWMQCETSKELMGRDVVLRKVPITPGANTVMPYIDIEKAKNTKKNSIQSTIYRLFGNKYSPHDLRHTFVSRCIMAGVNSDLVSVWVGHSLGGTITNSTYTHFDDEFQLEEAEKVLPD